MVEIFTVGGGDYLVNVFQAVAAWTGNGGYKSLLQVVMVMGLALSAITLAFNQDWRAWINWFLGATLIYLALWCRGLMCASPTGSIPASHQPSVQPLGLR